MCTRKPLEAHATRNTGGDALPTVLLEGIAEHPASSIVLQREHTQAAQTRDDTMHTRELHQSHADEGTGLGAPSFARPLLSLRPLPSPSAVATMSSHPPSTLIQPSRPTTATSSDTHSSSARGLSALAPPSTATTAAPPLRQRGPIPNLLPLFTKSASVRGTVRIKVEDTVFLAHRDVLALGSPFFESLLLGDWRETVKQQRKPQPQPSSCPRGDEEFEREHGEEDGPAGGSKRESFRTAHSITSIDETDEEAALALLGTLRLGDEPPRALLGDEEVSEAGDVAPSMTASYLSSVLDEDHEDEDDEDDGDETIICRLRLKEETASSSYHALAFFGAELTQTFHQASRTSSVISTPGWNSSSLGPTRANSSDSPPSLTSPPCATPASRSCCRRALAIRSKE